MSLDSLAFLDQSDDLGDEEIDAGAEVSEVEDEAPEADDADTEESQDDSTEQEEDDDSEEEEELDAIDLDGEEVTLDQIRKWKAGNLREQDYTKKTTALADGQRVLSAKMQELNNISETLSAGEEEFKKALIGDLDDIDLKSLRDEDYPEYLKVKETIQERQSKFDELKEQASKARSAFVAEQGKILSDELGWDDKSKSEEDIAAFKAMAKEVGIGDQDASSLVSAKVMKALIDYAKLKKQATAKPPKAKLRKVSFKKSSSPKTQTAKPRTTEEGINSFFD